MLALASLGCTLLVFFQRQAQLRSTAVAAILPIVTHLPNGQPRLTICLDNDSRSRPAICRQSHFEHRCLCLCFASRIDIVAGCHMRHMWLASQDKYCLCLRPCRCCQAVNTW